jgi:hypothetical protein
LWRPLLLPDCLAFHTLTFFLHKKDVTDNYLNPGRTDAGAWDDRLNESANERGSPGRVPLGADRRVAILALPQDKRVQPFAA